MKVGQIVKIVDGSDMVTVKNGKLSHSGVNGNWPGLCKDDCIVIAVSGKYYFQSFHDSMSDTIIQNVVTKEVWYCHSVYNIKLKGTEIPEYTINQLIKKVGHNFKIVDDRSYIKTGL